MIFKTNLYGGRIPFMLTAWTFGECRHGHNHAEPCGWCGFFHPFKFLRHWLAVRRSER